MEITTRHENNLICLATRWRYVVVSATWFDFWLNHLQSQCVEDRYVILIDMLCSDTWLICTGFWVVARIPIVCQYVLTIPGIWLGVMRAVRRKLQHGMGQTGFPPNFFRVHIIDHSAHRLGASTFLLCFDRMNLQPRAPEKGRRGVCSWFFIFNIFTYNFLKN